MNGQPVVIQGYYLHYKNNIYKLIKFATTDNDFKKKENRIRNDDLVIYQPQYKTNLPEYLLWARPADMFFQNMPDNTPRFRYLGRDEEEVKRALKEYKLNVNPIFKKENTLNRNIAELVREHYAIHGFALHSETLQTQILYNKNGIGKLLTLPENEFFEMSKLDRKDPIISKYLNEINEAKKYLDSK